MKQFTVSVDGKAVNFKAYDEARAARKAARIAAEHKMFAYEVSKRKF